MSVHPWTELPALMSRLDDCLAAATPLAQDRFGIGPGADPYRGLYVGDDLVERLVRQPLDSVPLGGSFGLDWPALAPSLGTTELDAFETAVTVLALAPEVDLKYERIYGYLQDDVAARRPRVALALDLFCGDLQARLAARDRFSPDAPLRRQRMIGLGGSQDLPLLARPIHLDPQLVRHLVGGTGLDERVAADCRLLEPDPHQVPLPLEDAARTQLGSWAEQVRAGYPVRAVLSGADPGGLIEIASHLAAAVELTTLVIEDFVDPERLAVVAAEARLLGYAVLVALPGEDSVLRPALDALAQAGALVLITTGRPPGDLEGYGYEVLEIARPSAALRREWWERSAPSTSESDLDRLAARYRLDQTQIQTAARAAHEPLVAARGPQSGRPPAPDFTALAAAARRQSAHRLDRLAQRVPVRSGWDELVLPPPALTSLRELCDRVVHRQTVLRQWGLDRRTNGHVGINALFAGPSGTGKTMAAQVVAGELGLDLFAVDLSGVVSKYIGETEKNLDAIFTAAENTDAVLLFDEADSIFGKRSEVRDSHDRYANLEVSYLLQRMESHDGVAILATNLRQNLDEAFLRRLAFTIRFPFPEESERRRIWANVWPDTVPLQDDIDLDQLADSYKFSGGNIRNIAVCAAFLAAAAGRSIAYSDVLTAVDREYDKLGGTAAPLASTLRLTGTR